MSRIARASNPSTGPGRRKGEQKRSIMLRHRSTCVPSRILA
uniref:Uncharacterized protein n=1 Tax=Arundo donax TaxID=35708 RepID=A0A0A9A2E3_ARUDO